MNMAAAEPDPAVPIWDRLEQIPRTAHYKLPAWADYVELLCLSCPDREISAADALDRIREREEDLGESVDDDDEGDDPGDLTEAETDDKWDNRTRRWFELLRDRQLAFGQAYPFTIEQNDNILHAREDLTASQSLYVYLLLASNLRYFKEYQQDITTIYERLSAEAMRGLFPAGAQVHVFGTAAIENTPFHGNNLWGRINLLAARLGERVVCEQADMPPAGGGDAGLDVVAWTPLGDDNNSRVVGLGQCGCTEEWEEKRHSASHQAWAGRINFVVPPVSVVFTPLNYRRADNAWLRGDMASGSVLVDRSRFMHLLREQVVLIEHHTHNAKDIVDRVLAAIVPA